MTAIRTEEKPRDIETHRVTWQGIEVEVRFERNWLGSPPSPYHPSHLAIEAITPSHAVLPITETGYRSHFLSAEEVDAAGGPVAYVVAALDDAAQADGWRVGQAARQQLSLF